MKEKMLTVVIIAGGLATRLHPITEDIPKSLVEVAGKPFIEWQLEHLKDQGIENVMVCLGHLGKMVIEFISSKNNFGLNINFSEDGPNLLGTGGSIKNALDYLDKEFFVLYGDSYLPIDFSDIQKSYFRQKKPALMTILKNNDQWDKSNIIYEKGEIIEYNKKFLKKEMQYIDFGLCILSKKTLKNYPSKSKFDIADVYESLSKKQQLGSYIVQTRFYEIGSIKGLEETESYFLSKETL